MESFVTIHRTHDPIVADTLRDVLHDAGVVVRLIGSRHGALFGISAAFLETRVEVPARQAAHARSLVEEFLGAVPADDASDLAASRAGAADASSVDDDDAPSRGRRLRALVAAGVATVVPGGAHFYARRAWLGAVVLFGQIVAIATLVEGTHRAAAAASVIACGLFVFDVVAGQLAVRAWNRGVRATPARQLLTGAVVLFGLGTAGTLVAPWLAELRFPGRTWGPPGTAGSGERELRRGVLRPDHLPFPLHLDLGR